MNACKRRGIQRHRALLEYRIRMRTCVEHERPDQRAMPPIPFADASNHRREHLQGCRVSESIACQRPTCQGTSGSGPRIVTTTATPGFPPTDARTRLRRVTPRRRTATATASESIAGAPGCFRRGCCDQPLGNAILPTTALTSWASASLEHSRTAGRIRGAPSASAHYAYSTWSSSARRRCSGGIDGRPVVHARVSTRHV